jgi:hypothetical protein
MAGMMRVYFFIFWSPVNGRLSPFFTTSRYWEWFGRMVTKVNEELLKTPAAVEIIYGVYILYFISLLRVELTIFLAALEVAGVEAKATWGLQWVKVLGTPIPRRYGRSPRGRRFAFSDRRTDPRGQSCKGSHDVRDREDNESPVTLLQPLRPISTRPPF